MPGDPVTCFFPGAVPQTVPAITARLAVEPDPAVGALFCLAAGMVGDPGDANLVAAVGGRRDQPSRIVRWTVLMGLVRLTGTPDQDMLGHLCDCLFQGPEELDGWPFHDRNMARGAAIALGDLPVRSAPGLAGMLLERLAAGPVAWGRFVLAAELLLSLVFPDGFSPDRLTPQQRAAVEAFLRSGLLGHPYVARLLRECDLPGEEDTLRTLFPIPYPGIGG